MKLILAVTAASGAVYARQTAERLAALDCVESVALVYSDVAPTVMAHEGVALPDHPKFVRYDTATCSPRRPAVRRATMR